MIEFLLLNDSIVIVYSSMYELKRFFAITNKQFFQTV